MKDEIVKGLVVKLTGYCFITVFRVTPAIQTDLVSCDFMIWYLSALVRENSRCVCQFEDYLLPDKNIYTLESEQCRTI